MEKYVSNITNQHQALTLVEENTIKSRNLQLRWCQQEGRIGGLLLTCPLCNCNLVVIHKQKWICGNFGIQEEDCETPGGSKTKEAHFDMAGYAQLAVSLTIFPFIKPKKSSYPCGLSYGSIWPWSCHEHHMSMDLGRSMPQVTDLQTLTPAINPEVGLWPAPVPLDFSLGVPEGKTVELSLTMHSEMAL